jgi:hypothetical protein
MNYTLRNKAWILSCMVCLSKPRLQFQRLACGLSYRWHANFIDGMPVQVSGGDFGDNNFHRFIES